MTVRHYAVKKDTMLAQLLSACDIPLGGKVVPIDEAPFVISDTRNMRESALGGFVPIHVLNSSFLLHLKNTLYAFDPSKPGLIAENFRLYFPMPNMVLPVNTSRDNRSLLRSFNTRPAIRCTRHRAAKGASGFVYDFLIKLPLNANRFSEPHILPLILKTYPLPFDIYDEEKTHAKEIAFHIRMFSREHEAYQHFSSGILYFPKHYHIDTEPIAAPMPFFRL